MKVPLLDGWLARRIEERAAATGYTGVLTAALEAAAEGTGDPNARGHAAVEMAAGVISRAFASCTVTGDGSAARALTPPVMARIGRSLIRDGASLHVIDVRDGAVELLPSVSWDVTGDPSPATWRVRAEVPGPSRSISRTVGWDGVLHVAFGTSPLQPWRGVGPLDFARDTGRLAGQVEEAIAADASSPVGTVMAVPGAKESALDALAARIKAMAGGVALMETTAQGWGGGRSEAPRRDWLGQRIGPAPAQAVVQAREQAQEAVLSACGVPAAFHADRDGTAAREALRRLWLGTVIPLLRILKHEAEIKLGTPLAIRFDPYVLDMVGRANAFKTLTDAGHGEALAATGLDRVGAV